MHDLMHDLAKIVADECQLVDSPSEYVNENVRHVGIVNNSQAVLRSASVSNTPSHLRSYVEFVDYLPYGRPKSDFDGNISSLRRLRVLFLNEKRYESLPNFIGDMIHLRYLKVCVDADYLPAGITKLRYLQILDLEDSSNLRELPREFYRLIGLKHLRLGVKALWSGYTLIDMPPRFGELTSLQSLDKFIVGENNGLDVLSGMNLTETLVIYFKKQRESGVLEAAKANLKGKKLTVLSLKFEYDSVTEADELLEHLQPPSTLRHLKVDRWNGERFPQWGIYQLPSGIGGLTALQQLYILNCDNLKTLPESIGSLSQLRTLVIKYCSKLEALPKSIQNLTALERLEIRYCPILKTRCEEPDGDDWPLIQHIPDKHIE